MTAPPLARTMPQGRRYYRPSTGEYAPSVTTILNAAWPTPGLLPWALREAAEYVVANRKAVDAALSGVRLHRDNPRSDRVLVVTDPSAVESAVALITSSPWRVRDRARDVGSAIHDYLEAETLGKPHEPCPEALWPYVQEWGLWVGEYGVTFEAAEATVWGDGYAGTLDAIVNIGGLRLLVDYKTGEKVYPDAALQLYAYSMATIMVLGDGREVERPAVDGTAVLHLRPSGYSFLPVFIGDPVPELWEACRTIYRAQSEADRWIGAALKGTDGVRWTWAGSEKVTA